MSSLHLVDPELRDAIEVLPTFELNAESLADVRAMMSAGVANLPAVRGDVIKAERMIPSENGDSVRAAIYTPLATKSDRACLFHIHGGGYVGGTPEIAEVRNCDLAVEADLVVVSVDYRLAPEHPYPGPINDCYTALAWVYKNARTLGIDPTRIAVGGESAGGGLAAALAILARDRAEIPIAFQLLIYPMLDDRTGISISPPDMVGEYIWTPSANVFGWTALLGEEAGGPTTTGYAAAARAEDLTGLPPAFIAVGSLDLFRDEDIAYAQRLMGAGVSAELHVYPGAYHGFDLVSTASSTRHLYRQSVDALTKMLGLVCMK